MPKLTLNPKLCENVKPTGSAFEDHFDTLTTGLYLRVYKSGRKSWFFKYTLPGTTKRALLAMGTFPATGLKDARGRAEDARSKVEAGRDPRQADAKPVVKTIADLIDDRIALEVRHSADQYLRSCLEIERRYDRNVIPLIGSVPAKDFGMKDLNKVLRPLLDRGVYGAAHSVFWDMQALMSFACGSKSGELTINPIAHAEAPKKASAATAGKADDKGRSLALDEIRTVWFKLAEVTANVNLPRIVRLMLALGQRVGEVAGMRLSELNLTANRPYWTIPADRVKNKKGSHVVPLNALALDLIREIIRNMPAGADVMFPNKHGEPMRNIKICNALEYIQKPRKDMPLGKLGIPKWTSHDLRCTVSDLPTMIKHKMPNANLYMDYVLNHRGTTRTTVRQRHYNPHDFFDEKFAALDEWGAFLGKVISGEIIAANDDAARAAA